MAAIPRTQWITPQEQLQRLGLPIRKKIAWVASEYFSSDPAGIVAEYCGSQLDPNTTHWFTALKALNALPEKVPPLPFHIGQILSQVKETQFLALIPENFRNLNYLESDILRPFAERTGFPAGQHPYRFRHFAANVRRECGDIPFEPTHWELTTMEHIPGTVNENYKDQVARISEFSRQKYVDYNPPSLNGFVSSLFLCKLATEKFYYKTYYALPANDVVSEPAGLSHEYSHVRETCYNGKSRLIVGGFCQTGVWIDTEEDEVYDSDFGSRITAMAAVRSFY